MEGAVEKGIRMRQGCRGRGLGLSGAIVALMLGVALLVFAASSSRRLGTPQPAPRVPVPASASQSPGGAPSPSLSAPFARALPGSRSNPYRAGVVLLAFRPGVSVARQQAIEHAVGGHGARRLGPAIKPGVRGRVGTQEFPSPLELQVPVSQELAIVARLRSDRVVAYAEPNYLQQGTALPNDPSFGLQWGSYNTGQNIRSQNGNEEFGAWEAGFTGPD